ncbi:Uridylate kinase [Neofusicoccum parvum]|nr:Uridylate kinase [Neofusicoccum parvum]
MSATSVCFTDELGVDESLPAKNKQIKATRMLFGDLAQETSETSLNPDQTKLIVDLAQWLRYAWQIDPDAHKTFRTDLGKLALAARTCNYRVFNTLRIRCQQRLVLDSPFQKSSEFFNVPLNLKDKIKDIIDWYNYVTPLCV